MSKNGTDQIAYGLSNSFDKKSLSFYFESFQRLYIYFWVFSLIGHYLEVLWKGFVLGQGFQPFWIMIASLAPPYGFGAVAAILFIYPIVRRYKTNTPEVYVMCAVVSAAVEYLCAALIVLFTGHNEFWDYSNVPFNINGYVCLHNTIIFGLLSFAFLCNVYPNCEKLFVKIGKEKTSLIFWVLFVGYLAFLLIK